MTARPARIRAAAATDAAGICAVYNHYVAHDTATFELDPVTVDDMRARIAEVRGHGLPWLVAGEAGMVVGYAYATRWRTRAGYRHSVETSVYLAPDATGRGLGRALCVALLDALGPLGVHAVIGGIVLPNPASVALHEALGFAQVAHFRETGHKFGRWLDVVYWQKLL